MPLQTIQVEVPEGYEAIGYRQPVPGDLFLDITYPTIANIYFTHPKVILRKSFVWPEWLNAAAIAMDSDGTWWVYGSVPKILGGSRVWCCGLGSKMFNMKIAFIKIDLPKFDNWKDSLIINPNYKE